eukprot:CAMPEP_0119011794 /NCGR_PEP_ID=MMETSP1176-20130426/5886_1 /TAXON_ID=265551 /ORGANISM="Synedropsis recta cf, Strain CCMP1620" /LENGTH=488 /DNA_ID=CAMNT_0006964661 /DNA_START=54 /DNA_END=1520 /DNA_ORIENTATION=+
MLVHVHTCLGLFALLSVVSSFSPLRSSTAGRARSQTWLQEAVKPTSTTTTTTTLDDKQLDFCRGYLNKHHSDVLCLFAEAFSDLGVQKAERNGFSGGSYKIVNSQVTNVSSQSLDLEVTIEDRDEKEPLIEKVTIPLDAALMVKKPYFISLPPVPEMDSDVDNLIRQLNRLCHQVKRPDVTGKLIQMGLNFGSSVGEVKENMWLNQIPHNRYVRQYFYDLACDAVMEAVVKCSQGEISNRMKMVAMFPELNPSMDSYRIGTLLEMARSIAIGLAEQNLRVRICVQGSMGVGIFTGLPKQLSGVATLLQRMDWQSGEGEENEGMIGNFVNFGAVGKEHVVNAHVDADGKKVEQDDVFLLLCPQSTVGIESCIIPPMQEMVEAVGDRPIIILNADLVDRPSAQGQQSVRGRKERIEFAESFETIFHFANLYVSGTSYFPILGSVTKLKPSQPWVAHQRRDRLQDKGEVYVPIVGGEVKPESEDIKQGFES